MIAPDGRCPICSEELAPEGELLLCPNGDYKANKEAFSARWDRYFKEEKEPPEFYNAIAAAESLLRDLKEMNIRSDHEEDSTTDGRRGEDDLNLLE